jgi:hypothetical protein
VSLLKVEVPELWMDRVFDEITVSTVVMITASLGVKILLLNHHDHKRQSSTQLGVNFIKFLYMATGSYSPISQSAVNLTSSKYFCTDEKSFSDRY